MNQKNREISRSAPEVEEDEMMREVNEVNDPYDPAVGRREESEERFITDDFLSCRLRDA